MSKTSANMFGKNDKAAITIVDEGMATLSISGWDIVLTHESRTDKVFSECGFPFYEGIISEKMFLEFKVTPTSFLSVMLDPDAYRIVIKGPGKNRGTREIVAPFGQIVCTDVVGGASSLRFELFVADGLAVTIIDDLEWKWYEWQWHKSKWRNLATKIKTLRNSEQEA